MKLYIGNKNYSSWSLRPWLMLRQSGIAFEEVMVRFDAFTGDSQFKRRLGAISPAGKVPVLVHGELAVWDTLAIAEYVAETFPDKKLWPEGVADRARARSVCAEMHAGFGGLRGQCPMNIEASLPHIGALVMRDHAQAAADLARIVDMWTELLSTHPHADGMLFGRFGIADAYYAPVCSRIRTYALPVPPLVAAYVDRVHALHAMAQWTQEALAEHDFITFDEPYRVNMRG